MGRYLQDGYVAHHKDGNKVNDEPSNLEEKLRSIHTREHSKKPITHGRPGGYRRGCRCDKCKNAQAVCMQAWRDKQ